MENQPVVSNPVQQPNIPIPPEPKHRSFLTSKLFLITLAIGVIFTIVYAGIYLYLGSQLDQISKPNHTVIITQPSPTPVDETISWKTYTNDEIEFKYPETWKEIKSIIPTSIPETSFTNPDENYFLRFRTAENYSQITKKPFSSLQEYMSPFHSDLATPISLDDQNGFRLQPYNTFDNAGHAGWHNGLYVFSTDRTFIYTLTLSTTKDVDENGSKLFDQILSTFKFTNPENQVVCTADAKLCPDGSYVSRQPPNCEFAACPQK